MMEERMPKKVAKSPIKKSSKKLPNVAVLFENKNLLIVNKPAGLVVHSDGKTDEPNLCDWILAEYPKIAGVGEPARTPEGKEVDRPGIVHRLDRETSGALIIAKTQKAFEYLKEAFQNHGIQKTYNAFVWGIVKENEGKIERPIGRSKNDFRKWSAERFARGELRPALTEYKVIKRHEEEGKTDYLGRFTYIEAYPKTGRTHQIRVHFKAVNHPVVGDTLYAPNHPRGKEGLGFERLALHARRIEFKDQDGKAISVEAPLPADFVEALKGF
jgi:23S rRNA pseudouridine1911/1915/1917 synthase